MLLGLLDWDPFEPIELNSPDELGAGAFPKSMLPLGSKPVSGPRLSPLGPGSGLLPSNPKPGLFASKLGPLSLFPGALKSKFWSVFGPGPLPGSIGPGWSNPTSPGTNTSIDVENILPPPDGPPPNNVANKFPELTLSATVCAPLATLLADFSATFSALVADLELFDELVVAVNADWVWFPPVTVPKLSLLITP